jgi:hypothetical protein
MKSQGAWEWSNRVENRGNDTKKWHPGAEARRAGNLGIGTAIPFNAQTLTQNPVGLPMATGGLVRVLQHQFGKITGKLLKGNSLVPNLKLGPIHALTSIAEAVYEPIP